MDSTLHFVGAAALWYQPVRVKTSLNENSCCIGHQQLANLSPWPKRWHYLRWLQRCSSFVLLRGVMQIWKCNSLVQKLFGGIWFMQLERGHTHPHSKQVGLTHSTWCRFWINTTSELCLAPYFGRSVSSNHFVASTLCQFFFLVQPWSNILV